MKVGKHNMNFMVVKTDSPTLYKCIKTFSTQSRGDGKASPPGLEGEMISFLLVHDFSIIPS